MALIQRKQGSLIALGSLLQKEIFINGRRTPETANLPEIKKWFGTEMGKHTLEK